MFHKVSAIPLWCGNVTEWGPAAETYFIGRKAEEAHAFLVATRSNAWPIMAGV